MDAQKTSTWVQTITGVAVLAGLGLVVWELQQNRDAIASQLTSDGISYMSALNAAVLGEKTADVLAKACESPEELSTADYYVLEHYYIEVVNRIHRVALLQQRGDFYDEARLDGSPGLSYILDSGPGRAYLKLHQVNDERIGHIIQAKLEAWDGPSCSEYINEWRAAAQQESTYSN